MSGTLGKLIDHSLLHGPGTTAEIERICNEAFQLGLRGVSTPTCWTRECVRHLKKLADEATPQRPTNTLPLVTAIVGHPWGEMTLAAKLEEIQQAGRAGAKGVEFVPNLGLFLSGANGALAFREEITKALYFCREMGITGRIALGMRSPLLRRGELKQDLCRLARSAGVTEVQPTTGWDHDVTDPEDIEILRCYFGQSAVIKAGGAFNLISAQMMFNAGANIIGGNGAAIIARAQAEDRGMKPAAPRV